MRSSKHAIPGRATGHQDGEHHPVDGSPGPLTHIRAGAAPITPALTRTPPQLSAPEAGPEVRSDQRRGRGRRGPGTEHAALHPQYLPRRGPCREPPTRSRNRNRSVRLHTVQAWIHRRVRAMRAAVLCASRSTPLMIEEFSRVCHWRPIQCRPGTGEAPRRCRGVPSGFRAPGTPDPGGVLVEPGAPQHRLDGRLGSVGESQ